MTEKQHRILYNMGLNLSCDNVGGIHLCPDKATYWYTMYSAERKKEKNGLKIQLRKKTGKEEIKGQSKAQVCQIYSCEARIKMVYDTATKNEEIEKDMNELRENMDISDAVFVVGLEKTKMLKKEEDQRDICMMDLEGAFDEALMLTHFISLFRCLLLEIKEDYTGVDVIKRLAELLGNWEEIYRHRKNFLDQIEQYIKMTVKGLEKITGVREDIKFINEKNKMVFLHKQDKVDRLSFFFNEKINKERFQIWATLLYRFLENYARYREDVREPAERVNEALKKYVIENLGLNKLKGLSKLDLNSEVSIKADAGLIEEYLRREIRCDADIYMLELIA